MQEYQKVLLLNQSYEPICFCSTRKALSLFFLDKIDVVEVVPDSFVRWTKGNVPTPSIIRLRRRVTRVKFNVRLSKRNVFKRDLHSCSYCGNKENLTIDHVIPKSRGGATTWDNLVTACIRCNNVKGNRLPSEAGMTLQRNPKRPNRIFFMTLCIDKIRDEWKQYLYLN